MDMYPPSDHELDSLLHVVLTSDADWNPTMADIEIDSGNVWYDALDTEPPPGTSAYGDTKFNQLGYYRQQVLSLRQSTIISPNTLDDVIAYVDTIKSFYGNVDSVHGGGHDNKEIFDTIIVVTNICRVRL